MADRRWMLALVLVAAFACGGDDGGDDGSDAPDTADDETPASDDFAPQDTGDDDGGSTGADSTSTGGAGGCVEAGQACTAADYCNTWICTCNAGATELMTIGSCDNGTCTADGNAACEAICQQSGGVASSFDAGCS